MVKCQVHPFFCARSSPDLWSKADLLTKHQGEDCWSASQIETEVDRFPSDRDHLTNLSDSTRYIHIGFSPQNGMVRPTVVYTNWGHNFNLARYHHHVLVMTIASKILNVSLLMSSPDS